MTDSFQPPFAWQGLALASQITGLRKAVWTWVQDAGLPEEVVEAIALATYEALANVVEHAYADGVVGQLGLRIDVTEEGLAVVVTDHGRWRTPSRDPGHRGRGLLLMERLAAQVKVSSAEDGTTVRMRWPVRHNPAGRDDEPDECGHDQVRSQVDAMANEDVEDRLRGIEAVTDATLARLDSEALLQEMLERIRDLLRVDTATVLLYDAGAEQLIATAAAGIEDEVRQGVHVPLGGGFAGRVAAQQQPLVMDRVDETTVLNPLLWEKGLRVLLGVPMLAGGTLVGVLHVGSRDDARRFTDQDVSVLQVAADRLALTVQVEMSITERAAAAALQRSLLPARLPAMPGLDLAARYVPGAQLRVGGDWYDVFTLPGGRVGIVIGDVSGHGLAAAVIMGRLRSALRAYALDNESPAVVLAKLDRKANHFEAGTMATVAYGVIDPVDHRLTLSLAGHLPPLLALPGQPSVFLDAKPDPPVGFDLRSRPRRCYTLDLTPGSLLCFYTDGLIERRDEPIDVGLERLRDLISAGPAEAICTRILKTFVGAQAMADDVAVLIMRYTGPSSVT